MDACRSAGSLDPKGLELLFRGLEKLERMVGEVRDSGEPPSLDRLLGEPEEPSAPAEEPKKKVSHRT
jgi:hypothetical protein